MNRKRVFLKGGTAVFRRVKSEEGLTTLKTGKTFVIVNSVDYTRYAIRAAYWDSVGAKAKALARRPSLRQAQQCFDEILRS